MKHVWVWWLLMTLAAWGQGEPGRRAPEFALPDLQGRRVSLQDFQGKVTLLNFWACWCDTWKNELRDLKKLHQEVSFETVFVSVDTRERVLAIPALREQGAFFPILLDPEGQVSRLYGVTTVPTLLLLDLQGTVRYCHQGYPGNRLLGREMQQCHTGQAGPVDLNRPELAGEFLLPVEQELWKLVEGRRRQWGLSTLSLSPEMTEVAREYLQRMLVDSPGQLRHLGPEPPDARLRARGVSFERMGENLSRGRTAQEGLEAMLASPSHKTNLMDRRFERLGVAALRAGPDSFLFCLLFAH